MEASKTLRLPELRWPDPPVCADTSGNMRLARSQTRRAVPTAIKADGSLAAPSESPSHPILLGVVVCSLAATLINPYGWGLWQFLASTVRLRRVDVIEWQPLWSANRVDWIPWLAMTLGVSAMIVRRRDRPPLAHFAVAVMLGYASLRVARLAPIRRVRDARSVKETTRRV